MVIFDPRMYRTLNRELKFCHFLLSALFNKIICRPQISLHAIPLIFSYKFKESNGFRPGLCIKRPHMYYTMGKLMKLLRNSLETSKLCLCSALLCHIETFKLCLCSCLPHLRLLNFAFAHDWTHLRLSTFAFAHVFHTWDFQPLPLLMIATLETFNLCLCSCLLRQKRHKLQYNLI